MVSRRLPPRLPRRVHWPGWSSLTWPLRLTAAATASYLVATWLLPAGPPPLLAPLTALLIVQLTPVSLLASGFDRVLSVVAGVLMAVAFAEVAPLTWWTLALLIAASLLVGQVLRLGNNLLEVPISAMLVVGVGSFFAESAARQRASETLVGAGVGVAANLLFPPKVPNQSAGDAIGDLARGLAGDLERAADEIADLDAGDADAVAGRTQGWLDDGRRTTHQIPPVGMALLRAEESRRLNLRAVRRPDPSPALRQGLEAIEHSAVSVRSMFRTVHDAVHDPAWPSDEAAAEMVAVLERVFRQMAAAITAYGELVRATAEPLGGHADAQAEEVARALRDLGEARARLDELLATDSSPVCAELLAALLSTAKRLLRELDLEEHRVQRPAPRRSTPSRQRRTARRRSRPGRRR